MWLSWEWWVGSILLGFGLMVIKFYKEYNRQQDKINNTFWTWNIAIFLLPTFVLFLYLLIIWSLLKIFENSNR